MLAMDVPVGGGTDATWVASCDPWVGLYWLTTGNTLGGLTLYGEPGQPGGRRRGGIAIRAELSRRLR